MIFHFLLVLPLSRPRSGSVTLGKLRGLSLKVITVTKIYYSKTVQSQISRGKMHTGQILEEIRHKLRRVRTQGSHTGCAACLWQ